uniref:Glucokinase n=1 Tax=Timspurckia oligopyrenoides TaxID=708627 RepID=A0A7S0ZGP6_9RHOD
MERKKSLRLQAEGENARPVLLAGDVGGTNCRLILFETRDLKFQSDRAVHRNVFQNDDFRSFSDVLCRFLSEADSKIPNLRISVACFAVAGPVSDQRINFTNRDGWIIDARDLQSDFDIPSVILINDFVANGHGLSTLEDEDLIVLQEGKLDKFAPIALIGAGTGLGECFITPAAGKHQLAGVYATEGGHVDFAPRNPLEDKMLQYIREKVPHHAEDKNTVPRVSVERIVSGKGLVTIYEFLRTEFPDEVMSNFDTEIMESNDKGRHIAMSYYNYSLSKRAMDIFFESYGSEAGNVALKFMPFGGLYIAGGIAPKNVEHIVGQGSRFMDAFSSKGRVRSILDGIPVYLVMKEDIGMRGAHFVALNELRSQSQRIRSSPSIEAALASKKTQVVSALKAVNNSLSKSFTDYSALWALGTSVLTSGLFAIYITKTLTKALKQ